MDDATLRTAFSAHTEAASKFTRRMAIHIARMADTTPMAVVIRLERMGLLRPGSRAWFDANGGITREHERIAREEPEQSSHA